MNPEPIRYPTNAEAKAAILACGQRLYSRGLVAANDGNISVKVSDTILWVTPTGVSKGFMTEQMLVPLDIDGNCLSHHQKPSSEIALHLRIYHENPNVRAVVHAHPPVSTAFACAGLPLDRPVLQEAVVQLGTVPLAPYALPGSAEVADSVAPFCRAFHAALLEYHGVVTWGDTLEQAQHRMECVEQYATVLLHMRTLGADRVMPPHLVEDLIALRPKRGIR